MELPIDTQQKSYFDKLIFKLRNKRFIAFFLLGIACVIGASKFLTSATELQTTVCQLLNGCQILEISSFEVVREALQATSLDIKLRNLTDTSVFITSVTFDLNRNSEPDLQTWCAHVPATEYNVAIGSDVVNEIIQGAKTASIRVPLSEVAKPNDVARIILHIPEKIEWFESIGCPMSLEYRFDAKGVLVFNEGSTKDLPVFPLVFQERVM